MCEQSISAEKLTLQKKERKENNKITRDTEKIVEKHVKKSWPNFCIFDADYKPTNS